MNKEPNWNPEDLTSYPNTSGIATYEFVAFVPDEYVPSSPPYVEGRADVSWVRYTTGCRPSTKEEGETALLMKLRTML